MKNLLKSTGLILIFIFCQKSFGQYKIYQTIGKDSACAGDQIELQLKNPAAGIVAQSGDWRKNGSCSTGSIVSTSSVFSERVTQTTKYTVNSINSKTYTTFCLNYTITVISNEKKPTKPKGDTIVGQGISTKYSTNHSTTATKYNWSITPSIAGVISPKSDSCSIKWSNSYSGKVAMVVRALNKCGISSVSSDTLYVIVKLITDVPSNNLFTVAQGKVYPNPAQNEVSLASQLPISGTFALFNLQGQQVLEQIINGVQTNISLGNLPQGIYQYEVKETNGKSEKGKLMVQ